MVALLADYLYASMPIKWPGTDGLTLGEVVMTAYPAAADAGHVSGLKELLSRHPELEGAINEFFLHSRFT
jgi:hypothetical protein